MTLSHVLSKQWVVKIAAFMITLVIWEALYDFHFLSDLVFSPPSIALPQLLVQFSDGTLTAPLANTFAEFLIGLAIAIIVGVPCGIFLAMSNNADKTTEPYVNILNSMPKAAVLPVFLLFLGYTSFQSSYVFGAFMGVFPVIILIRGAVKNAKSKVVVQSRVLGASTFQVFFFVLMPLIARNIISATRIAASLVMLAVLLKELYVQSPFNPGIGSLIITYSDSFQTSKAYGLIFLMAMMTMAINEILFYLERRMSLYRLSEEKR